MKVWFNGSVAVTACVSRTGELRVRDCGAAAGRGQLHSDCHAHRPGVLRARGHQRSSGTDQGAVLSPNVEKFPHL